MTALGYAKSWIHIIINRQSEKLHSIYITTETACLTERLWTYSPSLFQHHHETSCLPKAIYVSFQQRKAMFIWILSSFYILWYILNDLWTPTYILIACQSDELDLTRPYHTIFSMLLSGWYEVWSRLWVKCAQILVRNHPGLFYYFTFKVDLCNMCHLLFTFFIFFIQGFQIVK